MAMNLPDLNDPQHQPPEEDDLSECPYYARYYQLPGYDPEGSCMGGCHSEPSCVTDRPSEGWPAERKD